MEQTANISISSLLIASSLVLVTILFSYWQKLNLEKETIVATIRAVIQLVAVGYVLKYIFNMKDVLFTCLLVLFMIVNAAYNASKRAKGIKNAFWISFISIAVGSIVTLAVLIFSGAIKFEAYQVVPVSGMVISNSMVAIGLCYKQLLNNFKDRRAEVETKLSLGADIFVSSVDLVRDAVKTGMLPTIDSAKTLGIVTLPGMMTGLILAGVSPIQAIKYQLMVTFMLMSTTSIASFIACYLSYSNFFNDRKQLI